MDGGKYTSDMNVPIKNVVIFFPWNPKKSSKLKYIQKYCRWGISLNAIAPDMGYKTASGVLKFLHKTSDKISTDKIFEIFQPSPSEIIHLDEVESKVT